MSFDERKFDQAKCSSTSPLNIITRRGQDLMVSVFHLIIQINEGNLSGSKLKMSDNSSRITIEARPLHKDHRNRRAGILRG